MIVAAKVPSQDTGSAAADCTVRKYLSLLSGTLWHRDTNSFRISTILASPGHLEQIIFNDAIVKHSDA